MCPPTESMLRAMSSADRVSVPLNTRCSIRWDMPPRSRGSTREPVSTQIPTATERTQGSDSVTTRTPFGNTVLRYASAPFGPLTLRLGTASRAGGGGGDLELLLVGQRRLIPERLLAGQPDLAVAVDLDHLHENLVALGEHVSDRANPGLRYLGDVKQPLRALHDLDEGAELLDALHLAKVDPVELRLAADVLDDVDGHLRLLGGRGEHRHLAVVLHVDLGARLLLDAANDLAAGADDLADLLRADADGHEARRVLGQRGLGRPDRLGHLAEHVDAGLARLGERPAHDVHRDAADLDVHLQGGDALLGAGDLEVHVAVVIFGAHDVGEDADLVAFLDQAHGDAGHGRRQWHARVHERHGGAAHGGHGRRAVGLEDLRDHADRVREGLLGREHGRDGAMRESAVADLAPACRAEALHLARGERREVVVEHEGAVDVALERLDLLLVVLRAERCRHQRLGLSAREQGGAVRPRQVPDLRPDGPDVLDAATVHADALIHDEPSHLGLLHLLEVLASLGLHG